MMQLEMTPLTLEDVAKLILDVGYTRPMHDCDLKQLEVISDEQVEFEKRLLKEFGGGEYGVKNNRPGTRKE